MDGFVPAELRRESDNEQIREEKFIEIIQQLRLKKIIDVQLEILPSAPEPLQFSSANGHYFLGITKAALRKLLLHHLPSNPWLEAIFLPQSERFWRRLRKAPNSDTSWQLLISRLALEFLPKALEPFAHRRFLLKKQPLTEKLVKSEWDLVYRCADLHRANYHAWEHGRWLHNKRPLLFDFELFAKAFRAHITDCSIGSFCIFLIIKNDHVSELLELAEALLPIYPENTNLQKILEFENHPIRNRNAPM